MRGAASPEHADADAGAHEEAPGVLQVRIEHLHHVAFGHRHDDDGRLDAFLLEFDEVVELGPVAGLGFQPAVVEGEGPGVRGRKGDGDERFPGVGRGRLRVGLRHDVGDAGGQLLRFRRRVRVVVGNRRVVRLPVDREQPRHVLHEHAGRKEEQEDESVITAYTNLGVANVDTYLNIREEADEGASIIGKLPVNAGCEVIKEENDWYYIQSGSVTGYVKAEYILTGDEANKVAKENLSMVAYVNADVLMVREEKSTDSKILSYVANGEEVEVAATADDWTQVNIDDITGYVKTEYVDIYKTLPKAVSVQELKAEEAEANGYSSTAAELVAYAEQFLGNPYVWGGTSLTNGTDCSGFTMSVYAHFGYSLSRTSAAQSNNGTRVSLDELQPGDLLFYNHGSSIGHVAIYIGNGQIIHASTEKTGIIISNAFYTTPACATRILN